MAGAVEVPWPDRVPTLAVPPAAPPPAALAPAAPIAGLSDAPDAPDPVDWEIGATAVTRGGTNGCGSTGPMRRDTTTRRCEALKRGVHVVRVRRLSGVGSSTDTSEGSTVWENMTW